MTEEATAEPMMQGSVEWLRARSSGIGGSEAPALYNKSPWISQFGLWARKTGRLPKEQRPHPGNKDTAQLWWGTELEPVIRKAYALMSGREVRDGVTMARHPRCSVLFANTDGTVIDKVFGEGVWEGKAPLKYGGAVKWTDGQVPIDYLIQAQQYCAVTGRDWFSIAPFLPNTQEIIPWVDVQRDDRLIDDLCERAEKWWDYHVKRDIPPEPDGSDNASDTLAKIWPDATDGRIILGPELVAVSTELVDVRAQMSALKKREAALKNALKIAVGSHAVGELPDGRIVEVPRIEVAEQHRKAYSFRKVTIRSPKP